MTELSIGELDALVLKAYRGAGFSWGLSQEAGRAAAWLALRGLPAAQCFAQLLGKIDSADATSLMPIPGNDFAGNGVIGRADSPRCPVMTGTAISDFGWQAGTVITPGLVHTPLILIPFIALCAVSAAVPIEIRIDQERYQVAQDGRFSANISGLSEEALGDVILSDVSASDTTDLIALEDARRAPVSDPAMEVLQRLAARTYVPASDASRAGAGAGLNDND